MINSNEEKTLVPAGTPIPLMPHHFGCSLALDGNRILLFGGPNVMGKIISLSVAEGKSEATIVAPGLIKVDGEDEIKLPAGNEIIIKRTPEGYVTMTVGAAKPVKVVAKREQPVVELVNAPVVEVAPEPVVEVTAEVAPEPIVEAEVAPEPVVEAEVAPEPVVEDTDVENVPAAPKKKAKK